MSGFDQLPNWLRMRRDISGNAKVIWAFLRPLGSKGITVGQRLIGEQCGVDPKTARRCIRQLEDAGLVRVEQVGQRRARYHTIADDRGESEGETPSHVGAKRPGETPPPPEGETPPPSGQSSLTVGAKRPHTVGAKRPHDHTPYLNHTTPDLDAGARARPPADPTNVHGRWRIFESLYLDAKGGWGMGGFDGRRQRELEGLTHIPAEAWEPEVRAFIAQLDDSKPPLKDPFAYFRKHAGQWAQRQAEQEERDARGRLVVPDHHETNRKIAEREQAYRADLARRREPSELERMGGILLEQLKGGES